MPWTLESVLLVANHEPFRVFFGVSFFLALVKIVFVSHVLVPYESIGLVERNLTYQ